MNTTELKDKPIGYDDLLHLIEDVDVDVDEEQEKHFDIISRRRSNEYDTNEQFNNHQTDIRNYIIEEYKTKLFYRKFSFWSIISITFSLLLFIYLFLFFKSSTAPISFLITLTVSVFANLMALIGIVFKYVFSSTTEITDYASALATQEKEDNNAA